MVLLVSQRLSSNIGTVHIVKIIIWMKISLLHRCIVGCGEVAMKQLPE